MRSERPWLPSPLWNTALEQLSQPLANQQLLLAPLSQSDNTSASTRCGERAGTRKRYHANTCTYPTRRREGGEEEEEEEEEEVGEGSDDGADEPVSSLLALIDKRLVRSFI